MHLHGSERSCNWIRSELSDRADVGTRQSSLGRQAVSRNYVIHDKSYLLKIFPDCWNRSTSMHPRFFVCTLRSSTILQPLIQPLVSHRCRGLHDFTSMIPMLSDDSQRRLSHLKVCSAGGRWSTFKAHGEHGLATLKDLTVFSQSTRPFPQFNACGGNLWRWKFLLLLSVGVVVWKSHGSLSPTCISRSSRSRRSIFQFRRILNFDTSLAYTVQSAALQTGSTTFGIEQERLRSDNCGDLRLV
jgi:hypothetical protein